MAWKINIGGIVIDTALPDRMVDFVKDQLRKLDDPAKGMWLQIGDQDAEGAQQVYITPSVPILFTRTENDPRELLYSFEGGSDL